MREIIAEARRYARYGWRVVPVRGKVPIGQGWQNSATSEAHEVERIFSSVNCDGVGVVLGEQSGLIDLEADSEEAEAQIVELFGGDIPPTPTFQSTRGKHRLFQWSPDLPPAALAKAKWMAGQIEVRAGGGGKAAQTVFPPSAGRSWIIDPADVPLAELPEIVIARLSALGAAKEKREPVRALPAVLPPAPSDDRLDVSRWLARRNVEILDHDTKDGAGRWFIRCPGIDRHTGKDAVRDCVVTQGAAGELGGHCFHSSCGMTDWQSLKNAIGAPTFEDYGSGAESLIDVSGVLCLVNGTGQSVEVMAADDDPEELANEIGSVGDRCEFPADCLEPLGTLGTLVRYTLAKAMYPQPELALAASIALLGAYTGRKVADKFDTRTNVFILGLAPSGAGKDHSRRVNKDLISRVGNVEMMGSERIGSHAGIINALDKTPAQLMQLDEIGRLLETMKDPRRSPHLYNCVTVLMQLYSSSTVLWKTDAYADSAKVKTIDQPHLCIYGTSTPESFWQSLTTQNIGEGLIGRLLVFEGRGYDVDMRTPSGEQMPGEIVETFRNWHNYRPNGVLAEIFPAAMTAQHTPEAQARHEQHLRDICGRRKSEHPLRAAVWSRSGEKAAKLALIHACSRAGGPPETVELVDVEWGIKLANYLTRRLLAGCAENVSENDTEAKSKRVLSIISFEGITSSELSRKTQWLRSRERSEIVADLMTMGMIGMSTIPTVTKTKTVLRRLK